ncbi:MAG: helix-turn-helix transcriptional regulator [Firmicutes bacterium]|nr:helix-turn-helix transcriptional regulator [Bacillota bacterium]
MEPELSNIEVTLLSIVNENPSYAYEIDKTIDARDMRRWIRIGVASIYQVLKRLRDKGLVDSQREKEGRMPERNRYYITEHGKKALIKAAKKRLSSLEWYYLDLNIGLEASDLLTIKEVADCLHQRLVRVRANKKRMQEIYGAERNSTLKRKAVIKNLIGFRSAEENFLQEILQELARED